jgi:hypothetical protein
MLMRFLKNDKEKQEEKYEKGSEKRKALVRE